MASIKKNDNGLYFQRHIAVHPCRALDGPHMGTNLRCGWMFRWRLLPDAAECAAMVAIRDAVVPPLRRPIPKTRTAAQKHEIAYQDKLDQSVYQVKDYRDDQRVDDGAAEKLVEHVSPCARDQTRHHTYQYWIHLFF